MGRLRCGEWLPFAGVHDLIYLEQLQAIAGRLAGPPAGSVAGLLADSAAAG